MPAMRILCAVLLGAALFAPLPLKAADISGSVVDMEDFPVVGARVEVPSVGVRVWTDLQGEFSIRNLDAGTYLISAYSDDFERVKAQIDVKYEGVRGLELRFEQLRHLSSTIEVIGRTEELLTEIPGSVFAISKEELVESKPMDANEVLRRVPGVNLREDSGPVAMRLNVGMRGLNPDRSRKVLMLEDGLPISLAPYGEPEMYYSPPIDRMERIEVLKGSGQIAYGPQTIGGVVNFVTPDPPSRFHGEIDVEGGQRGIFFGRALVGDSTRDGSAGWVVNYLHKQGDGWRRFFFDIDDFNGKIMLRPNDRNTLTFKGGAYEERSNSTYLGLTQPMFDADPNQNPVSGDDLKVRRQSAAVFHTAVLSPSAILSSSAFGYHTVRNWGRQDFDRSDKGREYLDIVGDPSIPGGALYLRDSAGNRNREFFVVGAQSNLAMEYNALGIRNKLDTGVRYIYEEAIDQRINGEGPRARSGVIRDHENRYGKAFAAFAQNRFFLGDRLIFTPGIRLEHYNQERYIQRKRVEGEPTNVDIRQNNNITQMIPGVGLSYRAVEGITLFTGVHRGFAPPRTKVAITNDGENLELDAEMSWNYEAGVRLGTHKVRGEFTWFRMDFANQIITAAESGGATTSLINGGETLHQGLESSLRVNWHEFTDLHDWTLYTDMRHTYLGSARFTENELFQGNRLPYAPRNSLSFLVGARQSAGLGLQLDISRIGDQFGDNNETIIGSADGTVGQLPGYTIMNFMVDYLIRHERFEFRPFFTVKNALDENYIASRAPAGIQPGMFRQVNVGMKFSF